MYHNHTTNIKRIQNLIIIAYNINFARHFFLTNSCPKARLPRGHLNEKGLHGHISRTCCPPSCHSERTFPYDDTNICKNKTIRISFACKRLGRSKNQPWGPMLDPKLTGLWGMSEVRTPLRSTEALVFHPRGRLFHRRKRCASRAADPYLVSHLVQGTYRHFVKCQWKFSVMWSVSGT